jgi:hypothetical protein
MLHATTALLAALALMVFLTAGSGEGAAAVLGGLAVLVGLNVIFSRMDVSVDADRVRWAFRFGWFARSILIADIREAETAYVSWIYGYGVRWSSKGPLYRAWGLDCVKIHRAAGKPVFLGVENPQAFIAAIEAAQARWLEETDRA